MEHTPKELEITAEFVILLVKLFNEDINLPRKELLKVKQNLIAILKLRVINKWNVKKPKKGKKFRVLNFHHKIPGIIELSVVNSNIPRELLKNLPTNLVISYNPNKVQYWLQGYKKESLNSNNIYLSAKYVKETVKVNREKLLTEQFMNLYL